MTDDMVLPDFDPADLESIKTSLGIEETEVPSEEAIATPPEQPVKRKRGRPRKTPLPTQEDVVNTTPSQASKRISRIADKIGDVKPHGQDQSELAERFEQMLVTVTGLPALAFDREYYQMTEKEARNIAIPAASYLERISPESAIAAQVIEQYDLFAIGFGLLAYFVRVVSARREELRSTPRVGNGNGNNGRAGQKSVVERISELPTQIPEQQTQANGIEQPTWNGGQTLPTSGTVVPGL